MDTITTTDNPGQSLIDAWDAGQRTAEAMQPGVRFLGAWPEAQAQGYPPGGLRHALFVRAFLCRLGELYPRGVLTDETAIIKEDQL